MVEPEGKQLQAKFIRDVGRPTGLQVKTKGGGGTNNSCWFMFSCLLLFTSVKRFVESSYELAATRKQKEHVIAFSPKMLIVYR